MNLSDTIQLLKECNAGSKMAVSSIDEMLDKIKSEKFRAILIACKEKHSKLGNELHVLLNEYREEEKDPSMVAKGMSWAKTNMKMAMNDSDETAADLLTDGCNMGVKNLRRYLKDYPEADHRAKIICENLITLEEYLSEELKEFL